jgi:hypothetical protein
VERLFEQTGNVVITWRRFALRFVLAHGNEKTGVRGQGSKSWGSMNW